MENSASLLSSIIAADGAHATGARAKKLSASILIADNEKPASDLIGRNLSLIGHKCKHIYDGMEAETELLSGRYDIALLNVNLPGRSAFDLLTNAAGTAVILMTSNGDIMEMIRGFNLGADDYILKPIDMIELIARINAVLRRTFQRYDNFELDDIMVDFESRGVFRKGESVELTPREYELLAALIANKNIALSREKLLEDVWGYDYIGDTRTIDVHVQKLRKKLGWEHRIVTVYKMGYRLEIK